MHIITAIISIAITVNTIAALITVFWRPRSITSTLAWLMALVFVPVIGFILYLFLGRGLDRETKRAMKKDYSGDLKMIRRLAEKDSIRQSRRNERKFTASEWALIRYFDHLEKSPLTNDNQLSIFTDGTEKFEALFKDIRAAKQHVHVEYYSFFNDHIGNQFLHLLEEKAAQGLEVRLLYDPWGSPGATKKWFSKLERLGGKVEPFITGRGLIYKTRLNYHLHRKIVVVDGLISWTGGFNVGDQYLGNSKKFGPWRDTHIRIVGPATFSLQGVFFRDWNASVKNPADEVHALPKYFTLPDKSARGNVLMQIVQDGPDNSADIIKGSFLRMIMSAKSRVWIQTPYLIPDDAIIEALLNAVRIGVDCRIMIPSMPDHPFIYRATQYYANYLTKKGIKIYIYEPGFLHAKMMLVDRQFCTVGSTNQDIRSYSLNFECNAFIYDAPIVDQFASIFEKDQKVCRLLTEEMIKEQSHWLKFKQNFSRLLSPVL
ncbi:cardiolipin synthase [Enterococcus hirae]|nr:cardiolipin synthase [Enterococcus hirae]